MVKNSHLWRWEKFCLKRKSILSILPWSKYDNKNPLQVGKDSITIDQEI